MTKIKEQISLVISYVEGICSNNIEIEIKESEIGKELKTAGKESDDIKLLRIVKEKGNEYFKNRENREIIWQFQIFNQ